MGCMVGLFFLFVIFMTIGFWESIGYNTQRLHAALRYQTPDEVYFSACNLRTNGYSNSRRFTPIH